MNVLLRKQLFDSRHPGRWISAVVQYPLMQDTREPRRHARDRRSGPQPGDNAQPGCNGLAQQRSLPPYEWLLLQRQPDIRWIAAQSFAEEARRRNSDHSEWGALNHIARSNDGWIASIGALP